jgi:hypothetical protein
MDEALGSIPSTTHNKKEPKAKDANSLGKGNDSYKN